jgi:hypothetical protein
LRIRRGREKMPVGVGSDYKYDPEVLCNRHHSVMEDMD